MTRRTRAIVVTLLAIIGATVVVVLVLHQKNNQHPTGQGSGTATDTPSTTPTGVGTTPPGLKPIIRGLIDRQGEPRTKQLQFVHAYVVKLDWAQLQPTKDGPIAADNPIDKAIARVRQPDYKKLGMALKLRVFAGVGAPVWAKALGGTPIAYKNTQSGTATAGGSIGRFWSPEFEQAYAQLQAKLAAKYDSVPEIREVTVSGCTTVFDEPFVRQVGSAGNVKGLQGAGYTVDADKACIESAIKAHDVWKHTTSDLDFSPYPDITHPSADRDLNFTLAAMSQCRAVLGVRCGLQNNALSTEKLANPVFKTMYHQMQTLGTPLIFQTAAKSRLGDSKQVLEAAVGLGANSVELPKGYPRFDASVLAAAARGLAANPAR